MDSETNRQWHDLLAERAELRRTLDRAVETLRRYHDDTHDGPARWCEAPPCRLFFRRPRG